MGLNDEKVVEVSISGWLSLCLYLYKVECCKSFKLHNLRTFLEF